MATSFWSDFLTGVPKNGGPLYLPPLLMKVDENVVAAKKGPLVVGNTHAEIRTCG